MSRVALITGGTRGIGLGISRALAEEGFDLAVNGRRDESEVREVLEELRRFGVKIWYGQADISHAEDRARLLEGVHQHLGPLYLLVNNAGIAPPERNDILDMTEASYDLVMDVNLKASWFLTQAAAREMVSGKEKDEAFAPMIINIGSISATVASPSRGEYCLSKAGMGMMTQLWAVRLGEYGIPVYEVRPGLTLSDMTEPVKSKYDSVIEGGGVVQRRWGTPEDNGKAVAALARGDFPYSSGAVIMTDGGLTLQRL